MPQCGLWATVGCISSCTDYYNYMQMENQRALVVGSRARKAEILSLGVKEGYCGRECKVGTHLVSVGHSHSRGWEGEHS